MLSFIHSPATTIASLIFLIFAMPSLGEARDCASLFTEISAPRAEFQTVASPSVATAILELSRLPDDADNGLVTNKVPINAETLSLAYRLGVFPWDVTSEGNGVWFSPPRRGVLNLDLAISTSDRKVLRRLEAAVARGEIRVSFDEAFEKVIRACATMPRLRRNPKTLVLENQGTWITEEIIEGYHGLFNNGKAHSVEIWRGSELVGGMYGVLDHGVFTGESMFHTEPEVAKLALARISEHLCGRGFKWMDTQVAPPTATSLSVKWGAVEISRDEFRQKLTEAQNANLTWASP